jgi:hypothetical protein
MATEGRNAFDELIRVIADVLPKDPLDSMRPNDVRYMGRSLRPMPSSRDDPGPIFDAMERFGENMAALGMSRLVNRRQALIRRDPQEMTAQEFLAASSLSEQTRTALQAFGAEYAVTSGSLYQQVNDALRFGFAGPLFAAYHTLMSPHFEEERRKYSGFALFASDYLRLNPFVVGVLQTLAEPANGLLKASGLSWRRRLTKNTGNFVEKVDGEQSSSFDLSEDVKTAITESLVANRSRRDREKSSGCPVRLPVHGRDDTGIAVATAIVQTCMKSFVSRSIEDKGVFDSF